MVKQLYKPRLGLLTDLYQITMAYGYWKSGLHSIETTFQLFFRKAPFGNGFAVCAGVETALDLIEWFGFSVDDISYLRNQVGNDGLALFEEPFLMYLQHLKFEVDVDAVEEGEAVLANQPILRITGPNVACQLLESALLSCINFQTLIATKAYRVCKAAMGDPVLEFGLRRAHGFDGAISASRAAYIGGVHATSNVLAGKLHDIPVKGTHAHAWVMMFEKESEAFEAYANALPNNCVFLVDTYDTIEGIRNAIKVGEKLRQNGHEMVGIRLDSGNLTELSITARKLLNESNFPAAKIVASDSLNEHRIAALKLEGAQIDIWGVGTNLVTAQDQPALGGVYKLCAQRYSNSGEWIPKIKLSNTPIKVSNPGRLQTYRCISPKGVWQADVLGEQSPQSDSPLFDLSGNAVSLPKDCTFVPMLQPKMIKGKRMPSSVTIHDSRQRALKAIPCEREHPLLTADTWFTKLSLIKSHQP